MATFNLTAGGVRDLAMNGNVLFVSALEAGVLAFDASNPAAMGNALPFARTEPPLSQTQPDGTVIPGQNWAVAIGKRTGRKGFRFCWHSVRRSTSLKS